MITLYTDASLGSSELNTGYQTETDTQHAALEMLSTGFSKFITFILDLCLFFLRLTNCLSTYITEWCTKILLLQLIKTHQMVWWAGTQCCMPSLLRRHTVSTHTVTQTGIPARQTSAQRCTRHRSEQTGSSWNTWWVLGSRWALRQCQ